MKKEFTANKYNITRDMENIMLEILIIKQLLENDKISNRKELETHLKDLINDLIVVFNVQNKI